MQLCCLTGAGRQGASRPKILCLSPSFISEPALYTSGSLLYSKKPARLSQFTSPTKILNNGKEAEKETPARAGILRSPRSCSICGDGVYSKKTLPYEQSISPSMKGKARTSLMRREPRDQLPAACPADG